MGILVHTAPAGVACSVYSISSLDSRWFVNPAINIGGLGFTQCPCTFGSSSLLGRSGLRVISKKALGSSRCPVSPPLQSRAQLSSNGDDESDRSTGLKRSLNENLLSSVGASEVGDSGSRPEQPRFPYGLITGLASIGFVETAYLTWARLAGATVSCPIGSNCNDVLDSSYASVFGVPLALIGMVAYGTISILGAIGLWSSSAHWEGEDVWVRWLLLGSTTSIGAASIYFMYILIMRLEGASCAYCVSSAVLSLSLLISTLRGFTLKDFRTILGLQLAVAASVVLGLSVAFAEADAAFARSQELDLPPVEPEVFTVSSSREISLAKHLQSVGARMYGAFWCSHCYEQKQMFGREAMKYVDYVECYPEGYRKGAHIAKSCDVAKIQGFPTWIIKGQTLSGEQELEDLAKASGFDMTQSK